MLYEVITTSFGILPIPDHAFFEDAIFQRQVRHDLLQIAHLALQAAYFPGRCLALGIAGEPPLASFQELLRPGVIEPLGNPLTRITSYNVCYTKLLRY